MKSPQEITARLQRQWQRRSFRLEMLTKKESWPMRYPIGLPSARDFATNLNGTREHVARWQRVAVGEVCWRDIHYRASSEPISMPSHWMLHRPSDWILATANREIAADYELLEQLIVHAQTEFHDALIINLKLLQGRSREELLAAVNLASSLNPGDAQGRPLRLLAGHGVDTKFFERNRQLLMRLLDTRFDGEVSEQGLHTFLGAIPETEHWLLLVPLQRDLLPFRIQQVRSQELAILARDSIKASRILVIENRQCWHSLPEIEDTIAILGSGFDLDWLRAEWLEGRDIAYWGDMDTWGLNMLARARQCKPHVTALLTDRVTFERYAAGNAVPEPVVASEEPPDALNHDESELYRWLLTRENGRLEQEYLPEDLVHSVLKEWVAKL